MAAIAFPTEPLGANADSRVAVAGCGQKMVDIEPEGALCVMVAIDPDVGSSPSVVPGSAVLGEQPAETLLDTLARDMDIRPGESTEDGKFDLQRVACLGCCALAPVVKIDDDIYSKVNILKLNEIISNYE